MAVSTLAYHLVDRLDIPSKGDKSIDNYCKWNSNYNYNMAAPSRRHNMESHNKHKDSGKESHKTCDPTPIGAPEIDARRAALSIQHYQHSYKNENAGARRGYGAFARY
jgi:hypothetical protein